MKKQTIIEIENKQENDIIELSIENNKIWLCAGSNYDSERYGCSILSIEDAKLLVEKLNKAISLFENK